MSQETYDGQPVSYAQNNGSGHSSPTSRATELSELLLTPDSDPVQLTLTGDYSQYLCHQQQESDIPASPFDDGFIIPDLSFSLPLQGTDNQDLTGTPHWHSTGHHQFTWSPSSDPDSQNMMAGGTQVARQPPRQMGSEVYGGPSFKGQNGMTPVSPETDENMVTVPGSSETNPGLRGREGSSFMNAGIDNFLPSDNGAQHTLPAQAGQPEGTGTTKPDEPYAKLIYRALLGADDNKMALQEIYQWFRDNTGKANNGRGGWENSIRHNLSMNAAFQRVEQEKKPPVWKLAPFALIDGVQSTTRYRKGNPARRNPTTQSRSHRNASGRVPSGRSGGVTTSRNRPANASRSALTRATNLELLQSHVDSVIGTPNSRQPAYDYAPNPPTAINHMNWISPMDQAAIPPAPNSGFAQYTYHSEPMDSFPQGGYPQALYPGAEIAGGYGGPPMFPSSHIPRQHQAASPDYVSVLSTPHEQMERDYFAWN